MVAGPHHPNHGPTGAPSGAPSAPSVNPWADPSVMAALGQFGQAFSNVTNAALGTKEDHPAEADKKGGGHPKPDHPKGDGDSSKKEGEHGHGHEHVKGEKKSFLRRLIPGDKGDLLAAIESLGELNDKRVEGNLSQHDIEHAWDHFADLADWDLFRSSYTKKAVARLAGWLFGIPEHPVTPLTPTWDNLGGQVLSFVDHRTHHFHHDVENLCRGFGNGFALTTRLRRLSNPAMFRHSMGSPAGRAAIKKECSILFNLDDDLTRDEVETMTTEIMRRWGAHIVPDPMHPDRYIVDAGHRHGLRNPQDDANHLQFAQIYANAMTLLTASNTAAVPPVVGTLDRLYPQDRTKVDIKYAEFGASIDAQVQSGTTREAFLENFNADAFRATFAQLLNPGRLENDLVTPEGREEIKTLLKNLFNLKATTKLRPDTLPIEIYEILRTHTPAAPGTVLDLGGIAPGTTDSKLGDRTAYTGEAQTHFDQLNNFLVTVYTNLAAAAPARAGVPQRTGGGAYGSLVEALYHSDPKTMELGLGKMKSFGEIVLGLEKPADQDQFLRSYRTGDFTLHFGPLLQRAEIQAACVDTTKREGYKRLVQQLTGNDTVNTGPRLANFITNFITRFNPARLTAGSTEATAHAAMAADLTAVLNALYDTTVTPPVDLVALISNGPEKRDLYQDTFGRITGARTSQEMSDVLNEFSSGLFGANFGIIYGTGAAAINPADKAIARDQCNRLLGIAPARTPTRGEVAQNVKLMDDLVSGWVTTGPLRTNVAASTQANAFRIALAQVNQCLTFGTNYDVIFT